MPRIQKLFATIGATVPVPGTVEPLSPTDLWVTSFIVKAQPGNTGFIYIGTNEVGVNLMPMEPGRSMEFWGDNLDNGTTALINLAEIYIDADIADDGVTILYLGGN